MKSTMKIFIMCLAIILLSGCITSNTKLRLTDKNGNAVTISDQGFGLDIKQFEADGYQVEVISEEEVTVDKE